MLALVAGACTPAAAQPASSTQTPAASGSAESSPAELTRSSEGGGVQVAVTWNRTQATDTLVFEVGLNTHSGSLDGYDLSELATLRNSRGQVVRPTKWESAPGGHHRAGTLVFPARDEAGQSLTGAGVSYVELVLRDVAGVKERVLRWELTG